MFNSMAEDGHRGERPNEQSGSWFRPKCLSGQRYLVGRCSTEDVDIVNKLGRCVGLDVIRIWFSLRNTSGQMVVSMICKEE